MHPERAFVVVGEIPATSDPDDAQLIDDFADVRKQIAHRNPRLPARAERPVRLFEVAPELAKSALPVIDGDRLAVIGAQLRLGIEGVNMGDAAGHVKEDDAFRAGGEVRWPGR